MQGVLALVVYDEDDSPVHQILGQSLYNIMVIFNKCDWWGKFLEVEKGPGKLSFKAVFTPESHKKLLHHPLTWKVTLHLLLWIHNNTCSRLPFQPWQLLAFMAPPGSSAPWLGHTGQRTIPATTPYSCSDPPHPSNHTHTHTHFSKWLKEGTAALWAREWVPLSA